MHNSERIGRLLFRYMRNELSLQESKELNAWRNKSPKHESAFQDATNWDRIREDLQLSDQYGKSVLDIIKLKFPQFWQKTEDRQKAKIFTFRNLLRAAAVWVTVIVFVTYQYYVHENSKPHPGSYAGLIDGSPNHFSLPVIQDFNRGFQAGKAGLKVNELDNGDMEYIATNEPRHADRIYELKTYRGNAFLLRLPGMGKVWVNASTSFRYPANFYGDTLRIKLSGEAYFDMKKGKAVVIDFLSPANGQLPTDHYQPSTINYQLKRSGAFNVHAYPGDSLIVTDDVQSSAWKNKRILFENARLKTILDEISRWYDVDITYGISHPNQKFNLDLPRNAALSDVVSILKKQGAKIFMNGRSIYVL